LTDRILVLGAGGFIGRRLVESLASSGWARPVAVFHRALVPVPAVAEVMRFDGRNEVAMQSALRGVDGVVNCITGDAGTIVASARALFEGGSSLPIAPRIVHLSSMMVYGTSTGTVDEEAPLRGDWDAYSAAKVEVEKLARGYPSILHLRPGIVYGPGSPIWTQRVGEWLLAGRLGDLGAAGEGTCNLVHVDDVVTAITRSLRAEGLNGEAFNLAMPQPPRWNEYFRQFATALGTAPRSISSARLRFEVNLLAPPLKAAELGVRALRLKARVPAPIRPWFLRLCRHPLIVDARKAERLLEMRWASLEKGLEDSAASVVAQCARHRA